VLKSRLAEDTIMADIMVGVQAYCKLLLHAAKYPHCAVNGVLLAEDSKSKDHKVIRFVDCIPLFHLSLGLAPMLEIALLQVRKRLRFQNIGSENI